MEVLSLFSGIGAFEKALDNLGIKYNLVNYCEIDKYASKAYSLIHGVSEEKNLGDITKIDLGALPNIDLITYGFPCQDISLAGKAVGLRNSDGTLTRSGLVWKAHEIIEVCQPKIAICENVKNLTGKKFTNEFKAILDNLGRMGYNNYWKVLNAKDYGIPQNRERVFIISIRKDVDKGFTFPAPFALEHRLKDVLEDVVDEKYFLSDKQVARIKSSKFVQELTRIQEKEWCDTLLARDWKAPKCVEVERIGNIYGDACGSGYAGNVYSAEGLSPTLNTMQGGCRQPMVVNPKPRLVGGVGESKFGKQFRQGDRIYDTNEVAVALMASSNGGSAGYGSLYLVEDSNKESLPKIIDDTYNKNERTVGTLTTNTSTFGHCGNFVVMPTNTSIRKLTPKECWRFMGFADSDFDKCEGISNTQLYKMAGNSIVVNVLMEIFKNLKIYLTDK